jgi:hypothetical protein
VTQLRRIPFSGFVKSPDISASVPSSARFPLKRFLPRRGWFIVGDVGRFHSSLDEEGIGVEWNRLLRAEVPEEQLDEPSPCLFPSSL